MAELREQVAQIVRDNEAMGRLCGCLKCQDVRVYKIVDMILKVIPSAIIPPIEDDWLCSARIIDNYQYQEGYKLGKTEERDYIAKRLKDAQSHFRLSREICSLFRAAGLESPRLSGED